MILIFSSILVILFFSMNTTSEKDYEEMVRKLTSQVIAQIEFDIQNQVIDFSQQSKNVNPLIHKQDTKRKEKKALKNREPTLDQLRRIKQSKFQEIRQIERKEDSMKKSAILQKSKVSNSCSKLWRSQFTESQVAQIKNIIRKQKNFEKKLIEKEKSLEQWLIEKKKEDQQLKKQFLVEQCQQRKKDLQKQREVLQRRKQERAIKLEEEIKRLKQLKGKKLLHQKMSDSWQRYSQTSQVEKEKLWQMQRQKKKLNTKEIEEHQLKYLQTKKELQKKRQKVLEQSRSVKNHLPYIHAQIFYKLQKEEQLQSKLEQMKNNEKQDHITKKRLYSKQVNQLFLPKVKHHASNKQQDNSKRSITKLSLNAQESYQLGNNYMKVIHQKITDQNIEKQKKSLILPQQPAGNSANYKNYLKDLKAIHQKQNSVNTIEAVEKTLRSKRLNQSEKLEKVKLLFQKDKNSHHRSDSQLIEAIKGKLKVLQHIAH